jgi:hypothetical protein
LIVPVSKLPSFAVAVWGACPVLCHVTVSPTATVTDAGLKKKSPIVTLADAAFRAPPPGEPVAGDLSPITGEAVPDWSCGSVGVPAPGSPDAVGEVVVEPPGSTGCTGTVGVVAVVVVVPTGAPPSWAADTAGTAQIAARTSIPLARALAPFTLRIVRSIDS